MSAMDKVKSVGELRVQPRARLEIEVSLESEHNFWTGLTDNISEGGIFIATHTPPPKGTTVAMALLLPGATEALAVKGVVAWIREPSVAIEGSPPGCGLRWTELSHEARHAINEFVARRETIYFDAD
jgi:uncharacterized protein (TIGR02266 family)